MQILMGTAPDAPKAMEVDSAATVAIVAAMAGINVGAGRCRASVNGEEAGSDQRLREGDRVLFATGAGESGAAPDMQGSKAMQAALKGMKKYRNTLRALAR